ncbi:HIRA-interacting protein 5 [Leucosporidium creatinivorum]|uniref:HIRA-interacting protein 5 n=1 Tax=Leucosporidium creatinivorum TaxID=106004 RepID=A0A1Y2EWL0_9BASI|nr:HIRA-interacting protein 5 [Leucosporidium creatinivorum]
MFIQTETTPNADSLKFIPGSPVSTSGTHEFLDAGSSSASPLADKLFHLPGVTSLFFGPDFISVNKSGDTQWAELKPEVYSIIMEHFTSGQPLFSEGQSSEGPEDTRILDTDSEVVAMIKELLDTRVRPAIQEDGGDIEYRGFDEEDGRVMLSLKGSCRGCDSSTVTLKSGIERMLMHYVPEVKEVEQVLGPEEEVAIDEFAKFEQRLRGEGKTVEI